MYQLINRQFCYNINKRGTEEMKYLLLIVIALSVFFLNKFFIEKSIENSLTTQSAKKIVETIVLNNKKELPKRLDKNNILVDTREENSTIINIVETTEQRNKKEVQKEACNILKPFWKKNIRFKYTYIDKNSKKELYTINISKEKCVENE